MTPDEIMALDARRTREHILEMMSFDDGARLIRELGPNATHRDMRAYVLAEQARIDALAAEAADDQQ